MISREIPDQIGRVSEGRLPHNGLLSDDFSNALRAALLCELALRDALLLPNGGGGLPADTKLSLATQWPDDHGQGTGDDSAKILREGMELLLQERGSGTDCAQSPRVWMEDLLEGGPRGAGVGNMRRRLAQSLLDKQMCEEKRESGVLTTTTRYPPTWRWRDEGTDTVPVALAGGAGGAVVEKQVIQKGGMAATWTSREALVEQLQAWLLLPAGADAASEDAASSLLMGRRAALCGLAELCGVLGPAVLEGLEGRGGEQRDAAKQRLSALRAEAALGERVERWGWPRSLACVMACVTKRSSSWF